MYFNEIFGKNITDNNFKSHKKAGLTLFLENVFFEKK